MMSDKRKKEITQVIRTMGKKKEQQDKGMAREGLLQR